jgi:steroid 5-alpha reductase family enzyme
MVGPARMSAFASTLAVTLALALSAFLVAWLISLRTRDCSHVDVLWGLGFPLILGVGIWRHAPDSAGFWLVWSAVALWGLRLAWHLHARHVRAGREDARYAAMRDWHGPRFSFVSLYTVFALQAVIQWAIALPLLWALTRPAPAPSPLLMGLGLGLFAVGFVIEALADFQLSRFRADPANRGRLFTGGLFGLVRHPNYLGEIVLWTGIALAAFGISGSPLALLTPLAIAGLLLKVSGPPLLEAHLRERPGYARWRETTPALLPWPRRTRVG